MTLIKIIFWVAVFIIFYTYLGYGILLYMLVKIKEIFIKPIKFELPEDELMPDVTIFITAYNEEKVIDEKMRNCLALNYPANKLHIAWVTDGSNDHSNELLQTKWKDKATVLFQPERQGKAAAMIRGIKLIKTPIVVFTDANAMINSDAVRHIILAFQDSHVGCVAGEKRVISQTKDGAAAGGEGLYWKYESFLKKFDARLYSVVGAAGELFAVRRDLFPEVRPDTLIDDFVISLRIAMNNHTTAYCTDAYTIERGSADMCEEQKRKVRITAGGLQAIWRLRPLLNPFRYGTLSFQYVSHRVLRWSVTPFFLFALLPLNIIILFMSSSPVYITIFVLQCLFYLLGLWGYYLSSKKIRNKLLYIPYYFLFMNVNVFKGIGYLSKKKKNAVWEKVKRA
ncbi:MAG: glycosyltransferase family 2 protein [Bacteroidaceae bacterium]|nr:glycosyltransferase family 2 protein [Bacteroidaceae bacterium]